MGPVERMCLVPLLVAVVGLLFAVQASGALTVYDDRDAWEATLTCPVHTEDFESDALGSHETPYSTGNGLLLTSSTAPITIGVHSDGPIDGTQYIHFRNFCARDICEGVTFAFPDAALQFGFGFDYHVLDDTWELRVGDEVVAVIEENTEGFLGVVDDTGSLAGFLFYCGEHTQNGLSIDNLAYCPHCTTPVEETTWGRLRAMYR